MIYYRYWSTWESKWIEYHEHRWWMDHFGMYYRHQRVQQERRRWFRDIEENVKLRKRRGPSFLDTWGALETFPSCFGTRSWKKLKRKNRKQWM